MGRWVFYFDKELEKVGLWICDFDKKIREGGIVILGKRIQEVNRKRRRVKMAGETLVLILTF